jgi:hypothetical protein
MDGFANYGMPMGVIVQQTTSYLGAFFNLLLHNTVLSYNLVVLCGTFFSLYFFYQFLKLHFSERAALLATIVFAFVPYQIINIYIRGDIPEYFAHVFFPLVCMGLFFWIRQRKAKGLILLFVGICGILLTHPFTFVVGSFLFVPYAMYLLWDAKQNIFEWSFLVPLISVSLLALGATGYYILPLATEIKYFYYGQGGLLPNQHLTLFNYLGDHWEYFTHNDIDVRGHIIHLGLFESVIIFGGFLFWILKKRTSRFFPFLFTTFFILVFFTTQYANPIYLKIKLLGGIQQNWRMFTSIVFIPPILIAYFQHKTKSRLFFVLVLCIILCMRLPEVYGKNFLTEPDSKYYWNKENLHGSILNTVWTGPTESYPVLSQKGNIIAGEGLIVNSVTSNSWRKYTIRANGPVRMEDATFYFPGWKVYVDGIQTPIEFQDMNYRGVVTYMVPTGTHLVLVKFTDTKVRLLGNILSLLSLFIFGLFFVLRKRLLHHSS